MTQPSDPRRDGTEHDQPPAAPCGETNYTDPPATSDRPALPPLPDYEILGELGRGGMGLVYKARQTRLNRTVALKMILAAAHTGAADLERFRTESQAIARLQHPNIVQVFEVGERDGLPFFSLELCPGGSLDRQLASNALAPHAAAALIE